MAITRKQIKAANKRGSAAIARGPDARRALTVISLEGDCEFFFSDCIAEGRGGCTTSKTEKNRDQSERTRIALAAARCRPLGSSAL